MDPDNVTIDVCIGGLWRTNIKLSKDTTWRDVKYLIFVKTAIFPYQQILTCTECDENDEVMHNLTNGDNVMCMYILEDGMHPLHQINKTEQIRSWIASGADVNVRNINGDTPLMYASISYNNLDCILELLKLGANIDLFNNNGETALHFMLHYYEPYYDSFNHICATIRLLIEKGGNPLIRDTSGLTVVDILRTINTNQADQLQTMINGIMP